jgi:hypothetical protein
MKRILFCFLISCISVRTYAQISSCAQTLRLAQSTYEQGRLHELPGLLESCLKNVGASGFNKDERVRAYKLLAMAYIYLEEPEKADEAMLNLLRTDPYFTPNPDVDPAEFIGLFGTFRTTPIYRLGVKLGGNASQPNLVSSNDVSTGSSNYKFGFGFAGGVVGEIPIQIQRFRKFTVSPEIQFQLSGFKNTTTVSQSTGDFIITGKQSLTYVSLPILVQYKIGKSKLNPYVALGASGDYLLSSTLTLDETRPKFQAVQSQSVNNLTGYNKINISAVVGAGVKFRLAGGYFLTEVRFKYGLSQISNKGNTYTNNIQVFDYKYADGLYSINSLTLSVGYVQNFFNPKKLTRKK